MKNLGAIGAMAMLSMGTSIGAGYDFASNQHMPRNLQYTDSGKPMSKRRKRRLRGKAKP